MVINTNTPFDQYSRQKIVADVINCIREKNRKFSIVDVGGYKGKTQVSLPKDKVTVVDVVEAEEDNYVRANAMKLPMEDSSIDFVVSFDVIEHIDKKDREQSISEFFRVARRGVIICAPFFTIKNKNAETKLNELYKSISGKEHIWLKEHIDKGLPSRISLIDIAKKNNFYTNMIYNNDTELWMIMQSALFTNEKYPDAAIKLINLNKQYNAQFDLDVQVNEFDAYRCVLLAFRNESDLNKVEELINQQKKNNHNEQKIDVFYRIADYYQSLVRAIEANCEIKNDGLKQEITQKDNIINEIYSSKTWHYANKLRVIKSIIFRKIG